MIEQDKQAKQSGSSLEHHNPLVAYELSASDRTALERDAAFFLSERPSIVIEILENSYVVNATNMQIANAEQTAHERIKQIIVMETCKRLGVLVATDEMLDISSTREHDYQSLIDYTIECLNHRAKESRVNNLE